MTKTISVVYHSGYGHTAKVANAVADGAKSTGANVEVHAIDAEGNLSDAAWSKLDSSDAIIMGTPTYMGGPSWQFKKYADTTSKRWFTLAWKNKIAAGFTTSGGMSDDKLATLQQIHVLSMQHGMIWVGQAESAPMLDGTHLASIDDVNRIGSYSGLMTQSNHKSGPDIAPPAGDIETAKRFGKRIAEITSKFTL